MAPIPPTVQLTLANASVREVGPGFFLAHFCALGSPCQLFFGASSRQEAESYRRAAAQWLGQFESRCSRFQPESELSRINAGAGGGWVDVDQLFETLLDLCEHSFFVTQGAFDATSLPLSILWDWRRKRDGIPSPGEIAEAKQHVGWPRIQRMKGKLRIPDPGMQLDFGGVGKEFAVDALRQLAVHCGIKQILVDLGGDVAVHGDSPEGGGWYVELEDPSAPGTAYMALRLNPGAALATSGDYLRRFQFGGRTYGHIIDSRTGWPVANGTRAVSVVAASCVMAGIFSTSAMILGARPALDMLERSGDLQGCLWHEGKLMETRGFRKNRFARVAPAADTPLPINPSQS
jgi:thiamine biosynthesis lipoprotein